jgi:Skp family chaperone for outer membrane proteins
MPSAPTAPKSPSSDTIRTQLADAERAQRIAVAQVTQLRAGERSAFTGSAAAAAAHDTAVADAERAVRQAEHRVAQLRDDLKAAVEAELEAECVRRDPRLDELEAHLDTLLADRQSHTEAAGALHEPIRQVEYEIAQHNDFIRRSRA